MVESFLTQAIREFLTESLKEFRLPTRLETQRAPIVVNGYLAPSGEDEQPFVVVRANEGTTTQDSTTVNVSIIIGAFSKSSDGHEYCLCVMSYIRRALASLPQRTLAKRYQLRMPITWQLFPEQPYPHWQLDMETTWLFEAPAPNPCDLGEDFYG